jgi:hypothetical protein
MAELFGHSAWRAPSGGIEEARTFLRSRLEAAAQATFPGGLVVTVSEDPWPYVPQGQVQYTTFVAASDPSRPFDHKATALVAKAQLERQGWPVTQDVDGDIEYLRAERDGYLIEVFLKERDLPTQWLGKTPVLPA